jgi:DNA-directed RNA polymerase specialized sigma subunit
MSDDLGAFADNLEGEMAQKTQRQARRAVKTVVDRHDSVTVSEVVTEVASECGCDEAAVVQAIDDLQQAALVYLTGEGEGDDRTVNIP